MIETSYARAKDLLLKNQHLLKTLAEKLLEKEVIFKEDLEIIFGKRTFDKEKEEEALEAKSQPALEEKKTETAEGAAIESTNSTLI